MIALYLVAYFLCPSMPTTSQPGWWGWWDQSLYIKSIAAFAMLDFGMESHFYPIGYPAMGAIFYKLMPLHPMLIPNIFFLIVIIVSLYHIYVKFIPRNESIILVFVTIFLHKSILVNLLVPWSTIPTHALTYVIIYLLLLRQYKVVNVVVSYICGTIIFLCRPSDILFVVPFFLFSIINVESKTEIPSRLITAILSFLPLLVGVLVFNKLFYGSYVLTPYLTAVSGGGFSFSNVFYKAYMIFVESYSFSGLSYGSLLGYFPWYVIILPGLIYALKRYSWKILVLVASLLLPLLFYIPYNDCDYSTIFKYLVIHYINWTFPLWALFAWLTVRYAWREMPWTGFSFLLILPLLVVLSIKLSVIKIDRKCDIYTLDTTSELRLHRGNLSPVIRYTGGDKTVLKVTFNYPELSNGFYISGWPWGDSGNVVKLVSNHKTMVPLREYKIFSTSTGIVILFTRPHTFTTLELSVNTDDYKTFTLHRPEFFRFKFIFGLPEYKKNVS
ncbi:MAG: hypothetical protein SFH39_05695 [Candidatus Magnetobacterium sp. LHC-1]|nr:hypothetical protein [Nitrospirota bacterium]